jgi:hypothetical protein
MMEYEEWLEENDDELWISYHESGAYYDTHLEDYSEWMYDQYLKKEGAYE